jgi:hypothetical protein
MTTFWDLYWFFFSKPAPDYGTTRDPVANLQRWAETEYFAEKPDYVFPQRKKKLFPIKKQIR